MSQEFWPRVVCTSRNLNKNRLSSLVCFFFPMWFPSQFMTILWVLLEPACSFYELFASLGSPTPGRGIDFAPFWSETRGVLLVMAYTLKLRPKGVHFSGFRKGMFARFELQAPTTWNKGLTRFRQSLYFSFRPNKTSGGSRPSNRGGGGHPDSEIKGGPGLKKKFSSALFGLKLRGHRAPPPPSPRYATEDNRRLCSSTKNKEKNVSKP